MKVKEKTFEVKISKPSPEEAEKLRKIIKEVEEEDKKPFNPDEWTTVKPGELAKGE